MEFDPTGTQRAYDTMYPGRYEGNRSHIHPYLPLCEVSETWKQLFFLLPLLA